MEPRERLLSLVQVKGALFIPTPTYLAASYYTELY
jgi:hypothetical protein